MLADFPAGKALLEAEDHGNLTKDGDYWWSLENFQKPPPEVEDHGSCILAEQRETLQCPTQGRVAEDETRTRQTLRRLESPRLGHFPCRQGLVRC